MSDVERVEAWFASGALVRPSRNVATSVDLARALAIANGAAAADANEHAQGIAAMLGDPEHLVFVLVDGLGMNLVEALPRDAFFRAHVAMELQAVFPSTTAAALTSLATGLPPSQHAVTSWWTRLPDASLTATILPFIERFSKRPLAEHGVMPALAFPCPSFVREFERDAHAYYPAQIADSTYSRYAWGDRAASGYETVAAAVDAIVTRVHSASVRSYTYLYVPEVDQAEHQHGAESGEARSVLEHVQAELKRLAVALGGRARIAVSADHGLITTDERERHWLHKNDPLLDLLQCVPAGEPRVPFFHVRAGHADEFERAFRARLGRLFALLATAEAEELELFGPGALARETRRRIGDYIAFSPGHDVLLYKPENIVLRGYHGGLTKGEMRVPLLVA